MSDLVEKTVVQADGLWYVLSEKGKRLSRGYKSKKEAEKRLGQIEMFKHMEGKSGADMPDVAIFSLDEMEGICPDCAEGMRELGLKEIDLGPTGDDGLEGKAGSMPGLAKHLAKKLGGDPGFFGKCMGSDELKEYDESKRSSICAKAHKLALGKWPAEEGKSAATDAALEGDGASWEALRDSLLKSGWEIVDQVIDEGYILGQVPGGTIKINPSSAGGAGLTDIRFWAVPDGSFDGGMAQLKGVRVISPEEAKELVVPEQPTMPVRSNYVDLLITKASIGHDGTMRWVATASDTDPDSWEEATSLELFGDWIQRSAGRGNKVSWLPKPGMPFLGVAHYPGMDGAGIAGGVSRMYIDGKQFKASGHFSPSPLGQACYLAVRGQLTDIKNGVQVENPIRVSAAWYDLAHSHGGKVYHRKSLSDTCPLCVGKSSSGKRYLAGQIDHLALTRIPVHPRTDISLEVKSMAHTRRDDAASIIGEEMAEELENSLKGRASKSKADDKADDVIVVKSEEDGEEAEEVGVLEMLGEAVTMRSAASVSERLSVWDSFSIVARNLVTKGDVKGISALLGEADEKILAIRSAVLGYPFPTADNDLGGATTWEGANHHMAIHGMSIPGWDVVRSIVGNILRSGDDVGILERILDVLGEADDRIRRLEIAASDAWMATPLDEEWGEEVMDNKSQAVIDGFPEAVAKVLSTGGTKEEQYAALQTLLGNTATALKSKVEGKGYSPAQPIADAMATAFAPVVERIDRMLQALQEQRSQASPTAPVRKSFAGFPTQLPEAQSVSPVTGKSSALTTMIRRSVGINQGQ